MNETISALQTCLPKAGASRQGIGRPGVLLDLLTAGIVMGWGRVANCKLEVKKDEEGSIKVQKMSIMAWVVKRFRVRTLAR